MHLRFGLLLVCLGLIAPMIFGQQLQKSFTVDELVAKNVEAKGGADALRAIQSVRFNGKLLVNFGVQIELGFVEIKKRPSEVRSEVSIQGMTQVQAFDGKEGWQISPFRGRRDPEKMSADDLKELSEEAEIGGPLIDWKAKGSKVEYLGTEDVDGTAAHKLKVTRKNGDVSFVYLDPDAFLEIRILTQRIQHGAQIEEEKDLGDYEKVNGVYFPFSIDTGAKGDPDKTKITIDKAEANLPVDDAMFRFPAK
ncbi:MAG: hypothetical protein ACREIW_13025 [Chthoniobacterales bacterium]